MRVIAVLNQKGGSGKTTTTVNLASSLVALGQKVLIIDLDPQASSSHWYGHKDKGRLLYDLLTDELPFEQAIEKTMVESLSIIPSSPILAGVDKVLASELAAESILKNKFLKASEKPWDFILIDCPPTLNILSLNALTFAGEVLIPVETHVMALTGLVQLLKTVNLVKERLNPNLGVAGILPCRVDYRTNHSLEVVAQLKNRFSDKLCKSVIRENVRLAEAPLHMKPINLYDPHCNGTKDYKMLAEELLGIESIPEVPKIKQPRLKKPDQTQLDTALELAPSQQVEMAPAVIQDVQVIEPVLEAPVLEEAPLPVAEVPEPVLEVQALTEAVMEEVPVQIVEVTEPVLEAPVLEEAPVPVAEVVVQEVNASLDPIAAADVSIESVADFVDELCSMTTVQKNEMVEANSLSEVVEEVMQMARDEQKVHFMNIIGDAIDSAAKYRNARELF